MKNFYTGSVKKSDRIGRLVDNLYKKMPEIEADRAVLYTESYKKTEGEPTIIRKAKAFANILENIPIIIRDEELIVGSATQAPRGCQTFPEYSYKWLEEEFETVTTRSADPFYITEETKSRLKEANKYWEGRTNSDLATSYMEDRTIAAIDHNIFTPGNYFYNGIGHVTVKYGEVLAHGYAGIEKRVLEEMENIKVYDPEYPSKKAFLEAVLISCRAAVTYAKRYSALAKEMAEKESNMNRKQELLKISEICNKVPEKGADTFYEACQSFWFVQLLIQIESSGHSISPGRFDQYMYPYYKADMDKGIINREVAQELIDCVWVKLNDLTKVRDLDSAEGFAGYSQFQNLIAGGQDKYGVDATNDLSFMCLEATMHVQLPQPSLSVRVWNGTPHDFMLKAAELTRMGMGLPAYYNDEVIIPALISRGLTMEDARDYNIIGCVEPQKSGKTDGWHDAAFFNMCRPLELVFSNGMDKGYQLGKKTGEISEFDTFEKFYDAYKAQMDDMIELMVNADNAIDLAHAERNPLPYLSSMIDDCIKRGKSVQNGGAVYNFTGPQGFGVANMADSLYAIKKLVYDEKKITLGELKEALDNNYGRAVSDENTEKTAIEVIKKMTDSGIEINDEVVASVIKEIRKGNASAEKKRRYEEILEMINGVTKFGNNNEEVDAFARDVAYTYTRPLEKYKNPRGGIFHAGLYPVSANVPLGAKTGATPDGRFAYTPVADGVSPSAGKDVNGPTASANSVSKLDHFIASNGTLFNMKFHPSALAGQSGLEGFVALVRGYFDQKGSHMQFNVVSRETLIEAQKNPEKYKGLVVRVAGYSALFTTLSRSLQDDIINRTEQGF
ncbi:MAG: glycyl radical protein [Clostridia bacterium]|nr:glycyl radical protein [Clostridia bacterium]